MLTKITLHNTPIEYTIKHSRRTRRLRVAVYCDASVVVTAPFSFSEHKIERFLHERAEWVLGTIARFLKMGKKTRLAGGKKEYLQNRESARAFVMKKIAEVNQKYNFTFGRISIRNQVSRWGSCSKKRNLNFNYKITLLPEHLAEYIIAHELCHLREFNHSRNFWNLVAKSIPDYRARVKELHKNYSLR